ncbi:related to protein tag-253 [Ustilago trichophora]|uniref:Related to protein tag-253 n=1 Tax=Ustilago trichophora TaxID=86804 RepID=A0A5C3E2Y6_9BASI|nr:related to protein tag-253 [Ustilago trichophora]
MPKTRQASHAGSWYTDDQSELDISLSEWLEDVDPSSLPAPLSVCEHPLSATESLPLPISGCRAIIGPHAGYAYSGPAAAYAYRTIDVKDLRRVFILGPSHHVYLDGCAVSACDQYATPLGNLPIDRTITNQLQATGKFSTMTQSEDEDEHSIEMHLPYIYKIFEGRNIQIVPILVGAINTSKENEYGKLLAPYLKDNRNFFVISSDFCHWGSRFRYTYYRTRDSSLATHLTARSPPATYETTPIHESIRQLDEAGILSITHPFSSTEGNSSKTAEQARVAFAEYLRETKNTVCGRHPIGVLLAALAELERSQGIKSECRFTRYEQSSRCLNPKDSSVSYASAFVRFRE